jgi:hypothetical protein
MPEGLFISWRHVSPIISCKASGQLGEISQDIKTLTFGGFRYKAPGNEILTNKNWDLRGKNGVCILMFPLDKFIFKNFSSQFLPFLISNVSQAFPLFSFSFKSDFTFCSFLHKDSLSKFPTFTYSKSTFRV